MLFISLHKNCLRATPDKMMLYKLAICLFKFYNVEFNKLEFVGLNFNQILTGHQSNFISSKSNNFKVSIKALSNRFFLLNNTIPLQWLNLSLNVYIVRNFLCQCNFDILTRKILSNKILLFPPTLMIICL